MKRRRPLGQAELEARIAATDPTHDAWVAANAGSGKTRILRNRVIRLMLDGTPPDRILCLTYTRAAAAEMQGRIFAELARWVTLEDTALDQAIGELVSTAPESYHASAKERALARGLFARAIEAPGGLKVQTIHAFAERILHLFPIEAGVPLDFAILMDEEARALRDTARRETLEAALATPASGLGKAFGEILEAAGLAAFGRALDEALAALSRLALEDQHLPQDGQLAAAYQKALGVGAWESLGRIEADFLTSFDPALFEGAAGIIEAQKKVSDAQRALADVLRAAGRALRAEKPNPALVIAPFVTDKGLPKARCIFTKDVLAQAPELAELDDAAKAAWLAYRARRHAFLTCTRSLAMLTFAREVQRRYVGAKTARSLLDFDDLIAALRRLLTSGQAAWVLFKLDGGIDHVLIDEAQDTTRAMWDIIAALTEEFFAGEGARKRVRTLFAVGDEKQSIYSFQGADPRVFEEYRRYFAEKSPRGALIETPVPLTFSFRSSDDVLSAVDDVFRPEENRRGLTARGEALEHKSADLDFPGHVEFWPPARPREAGEVPGHVRVAEEIAQTIAGWLAAPERHLVDGRPIRPADILILVRVRNAFFEAVRKALKALGVPVAGADRLTLQNELVIQDLIALAQAVLVPEDDLTLASVLKSPLFGVTEAELEGLARGRGGSLRAALAERGEEKWQAFATWLDALAERARRDAPFPFFAGVLSGPAPVDLTRSVQAVLAEQLGAEIADPINAFLHQALSHAQEGAGALLPFVLAQQNRETQLKRDAEAAEDKVRVMTVHGAKGLEGRIVFLADAHGTPDRAMEPAVLLLPQPRGEALLLWSALPRADEPAPLQQEREARRAVL
ncbi:MAG: UvrD-helicase domain-containing protein, partial [Proteobacteria bacterium]|nr:UvrD-helicase domain-containing protein [Pseudomonadota bacterium]